MSAVLKTVEVPDELDWREYGKNEYVTKFSWPEANHKSVSQHSGWSEPAWQVHAYETWRAREKNKREEKAVSLLERVFPPRGQRLRSYLLVCPLRWIGS